MRAFLAFALLLITAPSSTAQKTAVELWKEAVGHYQSGDLAGASRLMERTLAAAIREEDRQVEADARFALGRAFGRSAQYDRSNAQLQAALGLFEKIGERAKEAAAYRNLGANAYAEGNTQEARGYFEKALAISEDLQDWPEAAAVHYDLTFVTPGAENNEHIKQGLELARKTGARAIEAVLLHQWADHEYQSDDFDAAFDRLNQARSILEELGQRATLARVLTSLGRLYRFHGHPDEAFVYYRRARDLHQEIGDVRGVIQSLNAMGVALNNMGRSAEALRYDRDALQLARQSGTPLLIKAILEAIGSTQLHSGHPQEAAAVLEEARGMAPPRFPTLSLLSQARFSLGQYDAAWKAAGEALTRTEGSGEFIRDALLSRAQAAWKLGRISDALRDVRSLLESVEKARTGLVATDFMKQGFTDTDRKMTSLSIQVMLDSGEDQEALESAERARGRALLDLLATRNVVARPVSGADRMSVDARSPASTFSTDDAIAVARRLDSTILTYWVSDSSTVIWTVSPTGRISHARTAYGSAALDQWIDEALGMARGLDSSHPARIATRGGETLLSAHPGRRSWRRLYDALIRPVRSVLPVKPGSRLTIVPSGPLFRLSFAALLNEKGRYLIEDYALHYSPAIDVFRYTYAAHQRAVSQPDHYLVVANPAGMPKADGKVLPALPGTEREAQSISRLAPGSSVVLQGKQASEAIVREAMTSAKVIHLATHGVLNSSSPLRSFLALGRTSDDKGADGRLTAEEVYALDLRADLVVLSACRTGLGRISGDGVAGLARAFLYAGAASLVATLWDVADQPTALLLEAFYRGFIKGGPNAKSDALRAAQLRLLRSLRKGELRVDTPLGALQLPEDPLLWAGYALIGEP